MFDSYVPIDCLIILENLSFSPTNTALLVSLIPYSFQFLRSRRTTACSCHFLTTYSILLPLLRTCTFLLLKQFIWAIFRSRRLKLYEMESQSVIVYSLFILENLALRPHRVPSPRLQET